MTKISFSYPSNIRHKEQTLRQFNLKSPKVIGGDFATVLNSKLQQAIKELTSNSNQATTSKADETVETFKNIIIDIIKNTNQNIPKPENNNSDLQEALNKLSPNGKLRDFLLDAPLEERDKQLIKDAKMMAMFSGFAFGMILTTFSPFNTISSALIPIGGGLSAFGLNYGCISGLMNGITYYQRAINKDKAQNIAQKMLYNDIRSREDNQKIERGVEHDQKLKQSVSALMPTHTDPVIINEDFLDKKIEEDLKKDFPYAFPQETISQHKMLCISDDKITHSLDGLLNLTQRIYNFVKKNPEFNYFFDQNIGLKTFNFDGKLILCHQKGRRLNETENYSAIILDLNKSEIMILKNISQAQKEITKAHEKYQATAQQINS